MFEVILNKSLSRQLNKGVFFLMDTTLMPYETFFKDDFLIKVEYGYRDCWGSCICSLEIVVKKNTLHIKTSILKCT